MIVANAPYVSNFSRRTFVMTVYSVCWSVHWLY